MRPEAVLQKRGANGRYLAPPSHSIIGAPHRHIRPPEAERKKTETRDSKSAPSATTG